MSENLDYEGMYKGISQEKREYKDQISAVVISSTTLESVVNKLVEIGVREVDSTLLEKQLKDTYIPVSSKLRLLRFAGLIGEDLYKNLNILFKIRNRFAHALFLTAKESTLEFNKLRQFKTSSTFLRSLPDDSKKFQLAVSKCTVELFEICNQLEPSSIQTLELTGDLKEVHEFE
ncbi:MAG: hypothetical protein NWE90_04900 [Candidatus Bathyarchaeota archaeon]|nr:hypothetical protein [Candidatus Bathyarchaeota archaeon]